jgi:hypothetical protein
MTGDDIVMKNKAADITNLRAKPCLKPGPPFPRFQPTILSRRLFVVSYEVDCLDKQVRLVQLVLAKYPRREDCLHLSVVHNWNVEELKVLWVLLQFTNWDC